MDTRKIIAELGGRKQVIHITGLTRSRISQWAVRNSIPDLWIKFFQLKYPKLNWKTLLDG